MASSAKTKGYVNRDSRVTSDPLDRNYVRYQNLSEKPSNTAAQFRDVSTTGMKLISRMPAKTHVGDTVDVQFTLPGSRIQMKARALVVRQISDFEFAVTFKDFSEAKRRALQTAVNDYVRYLRTAPLTKQIQRLSFWLSEHKQGMMIALAAVLVFSAVSTLIYVNSDAYLGKQLRSWGSPHPRQWDWDYYNKIPKQ